MSIHCSGQNAVHYVLHTESLKKDFPRLLEWVINRGGILGVRCGEILLISSYTLTALGRVSAKNVNKLTDLNAAVSSPA